MRIILALLLLIPSPALANGFERREIAYQLLNAVDAAQTCSFLRRGTAHELNPILGRNPSCKTVVGFKIGAGLLHYIISTNLPEKEAKIFQIGTIVIQAGVVTWNLKF